MSFPFFKVQHRPILIAHRGASGYAPENTLTAFKLALDMGARFIELDVQQTKDGHIVVCHDADLSRVAKVRKTIGQMTLEDLAKISIVLNHRKGRKIQEKIPTLEEVLTLISRKAVVNVEIKTGPSALTQEKVLGILERKGYNGMSYISSADPKCLRQVRALSSNAYLGYILAAKSLRLAIKEMRELRCDALVVSAFQATRSLIGRAHQRGFHVCVYTINSKSAWDKLAQRRVDAMFTDYPDLVGLPEFEAPTLGLTSGE
ncbi:MAG: glycerophosphodiester phosphodiesterase [Elusimicrobia bacterium]|nr:glycerophosphodiester phosphodiesterase [Elusimicrobiota bacterium]